MKSVETGEAILPVSQRVPHPVAYALELVVITAGYAILGDLAQLLPSLNPTATPCWPPTGFALALVLLCGYRVWPAILLGSFFAAAMTPLATGGIDGRLFVSSVTIGVGTVLAVLSGAWLINRS
jgi:integral membrane sensor domain MASE1